MDTVIKQIVSLLIVLLLSK